MQFEDVKRIFVNRPTGIKIGSAFAVTGLITYLKFRPITIVVSSIYLTWIYRTFYTDYKLHISKELTKKIEMLYDNLKSLRYTRPNVFCGFVSSFLFLLAIVGHFISGTWILLACLIAAVLVSSKYEVRIIKENVSTPSSTDADEFYPQMDESNMNILSRIGDDADDTAVYSKNTTTKSDNESDDSDLESLLPTNINLLDTEDVDDENIIKPLLTQSAEYKRKHFNATSSDSSDSSSTDDDSITRGLDFQTIPSYATIKPTPQSSAATKLLTNLQNTLATKIIENLNQRQPSQSRLSRSNESSDSDSDFEILDDKDLVHYKP